jgi:hypothetical protein
LHASPYPNSQKIIQNRPLFKAFAALLQRAVLWNFCIFCAVKRPKKVFNIPVAAMKYYYYF